MEIVLNYQKETKNYVYYETDMDFRYPYRICAKLWIPINEIETNIPGAYPPQITLKIQDDGTTEVVDRHPETGIPWN